MTLLLRLVLALLLAMLFLAPFNAVTGKHFAIAQLFSGPMLLLTAGIVTSVTLLAGSYPALFVSGSGAGCCGSRSAC